MLVLLVIWCCRTSAGGGPVSLRKRLGLVERERCGTRAACSNVYIFVCGWAGGRALAGHIRAFLHARWCLVACSCCVCFLSCCPWRSDASMSLRVFSGGHDSPCACVSMHVAVLERLHTQTCAHTHAACKEHVTIQSARVLNPALGTYIHMRSPRTRRQCLATWSLS